MPNNGSNRASKIAAALAAGAVAWATTLTMSPEGIERLKRWEGLRTQPYRDSVGVLTVCYGSTKNVHPHRKVSLAECNRRLDSDRAEHEKYVSRYVAVPLTQGQYDALADFVYNLGPTRLKTSTMLKKLNSWDCRGAAAEYRRFIYAGGKALPGLKARREEFAKKFDQGCDVWEEHGL